MSKRVSVPAAIMMATLALFVAGAIGCSTKSEGTDVAPPAAKPTAFRVTDAQRTRLQIIPLATVRFRPTLEVTGTVAFDGDRSTQVISPISGPAIRLLVNPGAHVVAGQALATVSSPDFAAAIATYRKAVETAHNTQRILKLDEQLFQNDALARSDLDQARAEAASAAADLEAAVQTLRALGVDDATVAAIRDGKQTTPVESAIRAPIAGTVVEKLIAPGQLLAAGATAAFTIADLGTMWVLANVYENDLSLVSAGQSAEIITDAHPTPIPGRVDYVAALVDPATKATTVRIVAQNPDQVLKRDMFVRVRIRANRERTGILIPVASLLHDDDNLPFVFISKPDGGFERRRVTVGARVGERYEITKGLAAGDQIVADGALFIQFAESQ